MFINYSNFILFLVFLLISVSCETAPEAYQQSLSSFPYDLKNPDLNVKLDQNLTETSALSLSPNGELLLTLNDEEGKLFYIRKKDGKIEQEVDFGKKGDYEGVELVNDLVYVIESKGDIHEIGIAGKEKKSYKQYKTFLKTEDDIEGLGYDAEQNQLLLACKSCRKRYDDQRVIYGFDLTTKELKKEPVRRIYKDSLQQFLSQQTEINFMIHKMLAKSFAPSAIAIHPISKDWYVLSSVGKMLVVLDAKGNIKHIEKLSPKLVKQPEGLCFDTDGTLYMTSEGDGGKGRLLRYDFG
ncbi:MAG: SdiA-regulated domain-containing protein [Bacteroidota bacterium]